MNKAIFLDRDGTLNEDEGYVHKVEDYKLLPGVIEALKLLKDKFLFFIITNQSGVGRGYYELEDVHKFNEAMLEEFEKEGIKVEEIFICPHHPDEDCDCRKPNEKFIRQAEKEYNVDLKKSYMIGDHGHDVELGLNVGAKGIYLLTGHGEKHFHNIKVKPDLIAKDLLEAAKWIIKNEQKQD